MPLVPLLALLSVSCDSGTEPEPLELDVSAIIAAVDDTYAPADASADATFMLSSFLREALEDDVAQERRALFDRLPAAGPAVELLRALALRAGTDIPAAMHGRTFVYDPATGQWVAEDARTGAPSNGIRVIWYTANEVGEVAEPLEELGYIDVVDQDPDAETERTHVLVVDTRGAQAVTLAEFTDTFNRVENTEGRAEEIEFAGFFSDGSAEIDIDILIHVARDAVGDEVFGWTLAFQGTGLSYRNELLDGTFDAGTGLSSQDNVVTVIHEDIPTVTDFHVESAGEETTEWSGTISHRGVVIATVEFDSGNQNGGLPLLYSGASGSAFSGAEEAALDNLVSTTQIYSFILLCGVTYVSSPSPCAF